MLQKLFRKVFWGCNIAAALGLTFSYLAPYIHPGQFWPVAIAGLFYPLLLLVNIFFAIFWLINGRKRFLLSLLAMLLGWNTIWHYIALNFEKTPIEQTVNVKLMSYNVQNFDLYNWKENEESRNKMLALIDKEQPDIIAFQEFYSEDNENFHNVKKMVNDLGFPHHYVRKTLTIRDKHHWGIAIFSKYEILNKEEILFPESKNNLAIYVDVEVEGKVMRFFNAHLQSIHFGPQDYKSIKALKEGQASLTAIKTLVKKLKKAFVKRGDQALRFRKIIESSPYPVIVMGDFNDTANSFVYQTISEGLQDAFVQEGVGMGVSFSGPIPALRIDYLLADSSFIIQSFKTLPDAYSDHYPIMGSLGIKE